MVGVGKWAQAIYGVRGAHLCVQEPCTVHEDWYTLSWRLWRVAEWYEPQPAEQQPARGAPPPPGVSSPSSVLPAHRVPPDEQRQPGSGHHSRMI